MYIAGHTKNWRQELKIDSCSKHEPGLWKTSTITKLIQWQSNINVQVHTNMQFQNIFDYKELQHDFK